MTHVHPYDPACRICQPTSCGHGAPLGECQSPECRIPYRDTWTDTAGRIDATFRRLDPDPLQVDDEPIDCECRRPNSDCHFAAPADDSRGSWLGCLVLIAVAVAFFVLGRITA